MGSRGFGTGRRRGRIVVGRVLREHGPVFMEGELLLTMVSEMKGLLMMVVARHVGLLVVLRAIMLGRLNRCHQGVWPGKSSG